MLIIKYAHLSLSQIKCFIFHLLFIYVVWCSSQFPCEKGAVVVVIAW